ncbi:MAG: hypothetical protein J6V39_00690, partial [Clostridia bacterium]|nr:hypothetical protein [Clostridia bacterium]
FAREQQRHRRKGNNNACNAPAKMSRVINGKTFRDKIHDSTDGTVHEKEYAVYVQRTIDKKSDNLIQKAQNQAMLDQMRKPQAKLMQSWAQPHTGSTEDTRAYVIPPLLQDVVTSQYSSKEATNQQIIQPK